MESKFVRFTIPKITTFLNKQGVEKKKPIGMPKDWTNVINETNYQEYMKKNDKVMCLLTGKINRITVLDFDNKSEYDKMLLAYPELINHKTVQTKRGFHIYCNYNPDILTTTNGLAHYDGVDIANDGHMVFTYPTTYVDLNDNLISYIDLGGEIMDIPDIILHDMKQNNVKIVETSIPTASIIIYPQHIQSSSSVQNQPNPFSEQDYNLMKSCLDAGLLNNRANMGYDEWRNVGFSIKHTCNNDKGKELFYQFSHINESKFEENETANLWNNTKDSKKKPITLASFKKWAKEENPTKYKEIIKLLEFELPAESFSVKKPENMTKDEEIDYYIEESIKNPSEFALAKVFNSMFGENFVCTSSNKKSVYVFNKDNGIWNNENELTDIRMMISIEMKLKYDEKLKIVNAKMKELKAEDKNLLILKSKCMLIKTITGKLERTIDKNNICLEFRDIIKNVKFLDKLDNNKDLFAFTNGVMDLKKMEFRPIVFDDFISMNCGYDYNPNIDTNKLKELTDLIEKIMPDPDVRKLYLQILSCGFTGNCIENFVIFNGCGGNGKGMMNEFVKIVYGDYGYIYAPVCLLTENDKTGANPEKVKLHKKRIVILKEPNKGVKLKNDRIRDITGGGNISGRDLYAGKEDCEIQLNQITILESNDKPLFENEPEEADRRRMMDVEFPNQFTNKDEEVDNIKVFKGDIKYKTDEWKIGHRNEFVYLLLESYKQFKNNNFSFDIPESVKLRTEEYLNKSFPILQMFLEYYELINESNDQNMFIKISDIVTDLHSSNSFNLLDKKEKRKYNKSYIVEFFEKNKTFKNKYFAQKKINGVNHRNIIMGYKQKNMGEDEDINTEM